MRKILFYTILVLLSMPLVSMAQDKYTLLEPLPCIQGTGNNCAASTTISEISLETYIGYIFKFAIAISAFLAVIMIIWGGFEIMLSEAIPAKIEGKNRVYSALIGLLMVLSSYLILRTIDPRLVEINTSIKPVGPATGAWQDAVSELSSNIDTLSKEGQLRDLVLIQQGDALQKELRDLDAKYDRKEITEAEYNVSKNTLELEIRANSMAKEIEVSKIYGLNSYSKVLGLINDPNQQDTSTADNLSQYTASGTQFRENTIYKQYEVAIAVARKNNNPEEVIILQKQRNFFIDQVNEEVETKRLFSGTSKQAIESKLSNYRGELANPTKISGTGIDVDTYNKILNTRITRLSAALDSKK